MPTVEFTANPGFDPWLADQAGPLVDRYAEGYATRVRMAMENSPASGRIYRRGSVSVEGGRQAGMGFHRASAPGEPPAPDTRELVETIGTSGQGAGTTRVVDVGVTSAAAAAYVLPLELGTSRLLPRPVWIPELQRAASSPGNPE